MTRAALLTLSIAMAPALAVAQVAPPPPPAPLATPAPLPPLPVPPPAAPAPLPAPFAFEPMAPMPPMPPLPADVFHYGVHPPVAIAIPPIPPIDIDLSSLRDLDIDLSALRDLRIDVPPVAIDLSALRDLDIDLSAIQSLAGEMQIAQVNRADVDRQVEIARESARQAAEQVRMQVRSAGDAYNRGLNALQQRQYEQALEAFDRVIEAKTARADAALYWKAFSEYRLARTDAALRTIAQLQKEHAQSRYLSDARVLETEARKQSGQKVDPAQLDDDEIKLLAIQGLERTEQVVPLLEGVLNGANSLNVKRRALYVLALRSEPRAREVLLRYAKGGGNPDLQMEGVRLLVSRRDTQTTDAVLRELYDSSTDPTIRRVIIDSYRQRLRGAGAPSSGSGAGGPAQSGAGTAAQELTAIYQRETDPDLRRHIAGVLVSIGSVDQVATVIKAERDPQARRRAIGALAVRDNAQATRALTDLYGTFTDTETREAIVSALAGQQNAEALIALARGESNVALKTRIVRHLSEMAPRSQVAADYLMDVIK